MNKNIILCADGTGNADVKARGTNVFKLYEAIDNNGHKSDPSLRPQVAFYDDGVGTSRFIPLRLLGSALGFGFTRNVKELYTELVRTYEPGDKIYLFGFSRGAYTVRTLAGLIQCCGIINIRQGDSKHLDNGELEAAVNSCWKEFRKKAFTRRESSDARSSRPPEETPWPPNAAPILNKNNAGFFIYEKVNIEFLGVWDTVSAIGAPTIELRKLVNLLYPLTFAELNVGPGVQAARHAISIDDERLTFHPELWNEEYETDGRVLQVWFPGVHANVGGGYPKQGMSLVALDWMMAEAEARGLRFIHVDRQFVQDHYDPQDKLYDSRASLAIYYRWQPRSLAELCKKHKMGTPKVHVSVFERIANGTDGYAPGNVPYDCEVVTTRPDGSGVQWPSSATLRQIQELVREGKHQNAAMISPFDQHNNEVRRGHLSYQTFIAATAVAAVMFIYSIFSAQLMLSAIVLVAIAIVGWLVRRWTSRIDNRLDSAYSRRWSKHRADLRKLLRTDMRPANQSMTQAMTEYGDCVSAATAGKSLTEQSTAMRENNQRYGHLE
jgi:uncharacterized protein (DUF2235 family)